MSVDLRALTLRQPWASNVIDGHKRIETRSWNLHYRGLIAIHASKRHAVAGLPSASILGVARLVDVERVELLKSLSALEYSLGDYTIGRFAFHLEDVRVLAQPVPYRGWQGLWRVDETTARRILRSLSL